MDFFPSLSFWWKTKPCKFEQHGKRTCCSDPMKIGLIQIYICYKRKNQRFTHIENNAEREGNCLWTWICRVHSALGPCFNFGFKRNPRQLLSTARSSLCTSGTVPWGELVSSACRWHTESTKPGRKYTWAHARCMETPEAGNNKDNFLNWLLSQCSLHFSQCYSGPQLTWKTCSQTRFPSVICLGAKKKKRKERKKGGNQ